MPSEPADTQGAELSAPTSPRVLVDATAVPADRGGVGRYADNLIAALDGEGTDLAVVCQQADAGLYRSIAPRSTVITAPAATAQRSVRLLWEQTGLRLVTRMVRPDVVHCPHYTMPLGPVGRPVVVTLHDATFFTDPALHTPVKAGFFRAATRHAVSAAARCIVPSQATRAEVVRMLGAPADRLDVAYHGVDLTAFAPAADREVRRVRAGLGLGSQAYVGFLGTLEPRKNVPALIRGWVRAVRDRPDPPALVLAGGRGWDTEVDRAAAEVPSGLRLLRPGYLPLGDLPAFLTGATVVAYPSLGEGFGLPVLEAMACGAAVLTTDRLSLPEVGGDAVGYTGASADEIGVALEQLLDDPARRTQLARRARLRAERFSWQRSAQQHLRTYAAAAGGVRA